MSERSTSRSLVVLTGTNRSRPTSMVRAPSKISMAAPMAVSIWITSGVEGFAGVEVLDVADQRQTEDALASVEGLGHRAEVEPQVVGRGEPVPVEVGQRLRSDVERLGRLAQHDPAVGPARRAKWPPLRSDGVRRTASIANGAPRGGEPARHPRVGHGAEVVGVGDEDVAVAGVEQLARADPVPRSAV